jgi:Kef-type K+ transport system membrane component KefB
MLTAAGLTETWLFQKARILAIFDDLDTILFMLPLKVVIGGFHAEILIDLFLLSVPLVVAWFYMHKIKAPTAWQYKFAYAAIIVAFCKGLHHVTKYELEMEPVHLEVLLPAFVVGCVLTHSHETPSEKRVATAVSAVFMFFVGLSTPPLTLSGPTSVLSADMAGHIFAVTVLMVLGKMFPCVCYQDEADWLTRLALSLGMCPRGEVGAGIIVISIEAGIKGPAIELAVVCLVINLVLSGAFVTWTKQLARTSEMRVERARQAYLERKARRARARHNKKLIKNAAATFASIAGDPFSIQKVHFHAWINVVKRKRKKRERKARREALGKGKKPSKPASPKQSKEKNGESSAKNAELLKDPQKEVSNRV